MRLSSLDLDCSGQGLAPGVNLVSTHIRFSLGLGPSTTGSWSKVNLSGALSFLQDYRQTSGGGLPYLEIA